jgi:shikimate kinase
MVELQGLNVYLIGMMGSGKTTISPLLAERLGYSLVDTDATIERLTQTTITELFKTSGEAEFRKIESQVLAEVSAFTRLVISTGGGIAIARENWNHLHQGLVIWLDPSLDLLVARLEADRTRPILANAADLRTKLAGILADRQDRYAEADVRIKIDRELAPAEIVDLIFAEIPKVLKAQITDN